jgi:hypothetical protein
MNKLAIFEHRPENVSNHNRSTKGWIFHKLVESERDFYNVIKNWEDQDFFDQEDGTVTDQNGSEVFDPERPDHFDFLDYTYQLVKLDELDEHQTNAISQAHGMDAEEAAAAIEVINQ